MEVADIIVSIREIQVFSSWPESSYHPIHNNCTTFAQELLGDRWRVTFKWSPTDGGSNSQPEKCHSDMSRWHWKKNVRKFVNFEVGTCCLNYLRVLITWICSILRSKCWEFVQLISISENTLSPELLPDTMKEGDFVFEPTNQLTKQPSDQPTNQPTKQTT